MATNLPPQINEDSATDTLNLFNNYGAYELQFPPTDVEGAVAFFEARGFDRDAAELTAYAMLKQAKIEGMQVFKLLDTLKQMDGLHLSALVGEILNNNRPSTSILGFKFVTATKEQQTRNIAA